MLSKSKLIIYILFLLITGRLSSQCDSTLFVHYFDSIEKYLTKDLKKAMQYATVALNESAKCPNSPVFYESVFAISTVYDQRDLHDSVVALILPIIKNPKIKISTYHKARLEHKLSSAYISLLKLKEGLDFSLAALKDFESIKDERNATNMLINISNIYIQQNNFKQADLILRQAEQKAIHLNKRTVGNVYNTLGILYAEHQLYDSAERFFLLSTTAREELKDYSSLAWNYNNLGGLYVLKGETGKAITYLEKALNSFKINENIVGQGAIANNLGELYVKLGNNKKALENYSLARQLYNISGDDDNLENLYSNLSNYYENLGDFKTAYQYSDSLIVLKDTLHGRMLDEKIAELQTKFDFEKKNLLIANQKDEIIIKEEQNQLKNTIIISILIVSVLLGLSGLLFYQRKRLKQKEILNQERIKQQELRSKAILQAEENERTRIARELHDGIGQQLSAAKLNLDALANNLKLNKPEDSLLFKNVLDLMDESVKEVRQVSHSMMPNTLLKTGLASALREFINRISGAGGLKINLGIIGLNERLDQMTEQILFRVLQEIVNNIIKHSGATEVTIQLIRAEEELTLMIEDNGVGFNAAEKLKDESGGIGLKNIKSRIEFLNGHINFDSFPGKGTTISIEVPLGKSHENS
ncbi:MAG: tetratricopeptide repeat-containing sensor histidine kinase [Bacteroidia bacterium]